MIVCLCVRFVCVIFVSLTVVKEAQVTNLGELYERMDVEEVSTDSVTVTGGIIHDLVGGPIVLGKQELIDAKLYIKELRALIKSKKTLAQTMAELYSVDLNNLKGGKIQSKEFKDKMEAINNVIRVTTDKMHSNYEDIEIHRELLLIDEQEVAFQNALRRYQKAITDASSSSSSSSSAASQQFGREASKGCSLVEKAALQDNQIRTQKKIFSIMSMMSADELRPFG